MSGDRRENWSWIAPALASYKEWEKGAIRAIIKRLHDTEDSITNAANVVRGTMDSTRGRAEEMIAVANSTASQGVRSAFTSYPEAVVGSTAVSFACVVGYAPKRTAFVALIAAICLRSPLASKWGDDCAALSGRLSQTLKKQATAIGLLSPGQA